MPNRSQLVSPWWLLPPGRVHAAWWIVAGAALIAADFFVGPRFQYPVIYVLPVILAAWYSGRWPAFALAASVPAAHIVLLVAVWPTPSDIGSLLAATLLRAAVILVMAVWFARLAEHERELHRHVRRLEGLLPICCFCKNIRTKSGHWEPIEAYISSRSEAQFSHGFCPDCGKEHYAEFERDNASVN